MDKEFEENLRKLEKVVLKKRNEDVVDNRRSKMCYLKKA